MKTIYSNAHLRSNFLQLVQDISNEDSKALIDLDNTEILREKLSEFCTQEFPFEKVVLIFHRYACIAYLSAEFIKNPKVYLDASKKEYVLLSYIKNSNPDAVSIIYSNIKSLSQNPTLPITIKDIIAFMECDNVAFELRNYYIKNF